MGFTVKETAVTLAPSLSRRHSRDTTHLCIAIRQPGKVKFLPGDRVRQRGGHKVLLGSPVFQSGATIFQPGNLKFQAGDAKILPGSLKTLPGTAKFLPGSLIFNRLRQIDLPARNRWSKNATLGFGRAGSPLPAERMAKPLVKRTTTRGAHGVARPTNSQFLFPS